MQKKLNEVFINRYSEKFASEVTFSFFKNGKESINGKEILSITPSKQVNYFIIKLLFRYWQAETKKLESPFFNYRHPEVKKAIIEFMNVLSHHIEVRRNQFELLLNHAIKDTLCLAASPHTYIEIDLRGRGIDKIHEKAIAGTLKYLKLYKKEIYDFLSAMKGVAVDEVIKEAKPRFKDLDRSVGLSREIHLLNEVLPITLNQVLVELDEFDDSLLERGEEDLTEHSETTQEYKQMPTAQHHEKSRENHLMRVIPVDQQDIFQKELFKDDFIAFQNALQELDNYRSFDEAVKFLAQNYAQEFKWNMQSNEVKEFLKALFRGFREYEK